MNAASLNITVIGKRMLSRTEAASYTGLSISMFKTACDVVPVEINPKKLLWDRRDLDKWIDGLKSGQDAINEDQMLERLG